MRTRTVVGLAITGVLAACTVNFDEFRFQSEPKSSTSSTTMAAGSGGSGGVTVATGGGTSGGGGMPSTGGMGGVGGAPECVMAEDCPGMITTCEYPTCIMGMCGIGQAPKGVVCVEDGGNVCDGMGHCISCNDPPMPPGNNCPQECTGGCNANNTVCIMDCNGEDACNQNVNCPMNFHCQVQCNGEKACKDITVTCPPDYECQLLCDGKSACESTVLQCSSGPCVLQCSASTTVCKNAQVMCGSDACGAICMAPGNKPNVQCGRSCACDPC